MTLGALVLLPALLLIGLRINATLVFLSLCLGNVLVQFVAPDANWFLQLFAAEMPDEIDTGNDNLKLILLLFPAVLTALFMIRTVRGRGKLLLNILPAAGTGLLGALLVVPLLPAGLSYDIVDSALWEEVLKSQNLIVGSSALVCMLVLWLQRPKTGKSGTRHK